MVFSFRSIRPRSLTLPQVVGFAVRFSLRAPCGPHLPPAQRKTPSGAQSTRVRSTLQFNDDHLEGLVAQVLRVVFESRKVRDLSGLDSDVFRLAIWIREAVMNLG